jgi:hypothetical protein
MTLNRFIKNTLKVIIPAAIIGGAWHQGMFFSEDTYQTGNVVAEKYIPKSLQEQTHVGFVSSHDYVGMGESQYLLTVNSEGRLWVLDVQDSYYGGSKEALDQIVREGSKVTFERGYKKWNNAGTTQYFSDFRNGRGNIYTSEIRVH